MTNSLTNYNDSSIQILEGLDAVRKRPGMYIGSTDARGLHHLVYEIVDNAVDEALAGFADKITVELLEDGSVKVSDNGRGMPVGMHDSGLPTIQVIFTVLHAGGKFGQGGYKSAGGLHGVGASVVNALSSWLQVEVMRDGYTYQMTFTKGGKEISKLKKTNNHQKRTSGTSVHFMPDSQVFSGHSISYDTILERLRESAFLLKDLEITLIDHRNNQEESFHYQAGLKDFIAYLNEEKHTVSDIAYASTEVEDFEIDYAFQFNDGYSETILSFANNVRTMGGGSHETGFKSGLTKAFNEYGRRVGIIKDKDKNLEGSDIREGIAAVISLRIPEGYLQFEGQTKDKLGTPKARTLVDNFTNESVSHFLNENGPQAQALIRKAVKARETREAARKARDASRSGAKKSQQERLISGKLTKAQSRDAKMNELYLVEGDSAGGSAKLGRNPQYQAILPLRGKVINTEKASMTDIMKNEEINTMIYTIGGGVGSDFNLKDINYDKVIVMTDADTDGAHIQVLLLTFFYRYMKPLLEAGKVYLAMPPLYKISKGKGKKAIVEYAWTDEELKTVTDKLGKGYTLQRYKGLGEMNAEQLWDTTMNPESRLLIRVTVEDAILSERRLTTLMGSKVEPRRKWIESNVQFTNMGQEDTLLQEADIQTESVRVKAEGHHQTQGEFDIEADGQINLFVEEENNGTDE